MSVKLLIFLCAFWSENCLLLNMGNAYFTKENEVLLSQCTTVGKYSTIKLCLHDASKNH